jgi:hypothetical protein
VRRERQGEKPHHGNRNHGFHPLFPPFKISARFGGQP